MKAMGTAMVTVALAVALAGPAVGFQCPLLIKQLADQVARLKPDDAKVKPARALIEEARKLHAEGSHAKAVAKADEAAKLLGIELARN
jgi:hypothetical protein